MKKYILVFASIIFLSSTAFCQGGKIFIGGVINFGTTSDDEGDGHSGYSFGLSPKAGFYINEKTAIGTSIGLTINGNTTHSDPELKNGSTGFSITPFIRHHFIQAEKFSFMGEAFVGIGTEKTYTEVDGNKEDGPSSLSLSIGARPGFSYQATEKITLEAFFGGISFDHDSRDNNNDKTASSRFNIQLNTNLSLGFIYFIR